jgi:hypothetical protein
LPDRHGQVKQNIANKDPIDALIQDLSASEEKRNQAERQLSEIARNSTAQRQRVIQALVEDVNKHDELINRNLILSKSLDYLTSVARIFSSLRAVEAVDVLIRCIYCGNGMTGSLRQRPTFDALVSLGELAVPRLAESLMSNTDEYGRMNVALCLGNIGGPKARLALNRALRVERSKDVIRHIKWGLATIDGDPSRYW